MTKAISKLFFLLPALIFCCNNTVTAQQYTLKGKVINKENQPVEFVHAGLFRSDSSIVVQISTDSLGLFSLKAEKGRYQFLLQQFGVEHLRRNLDLFQDTDLGEMVINESVMLEGITVTARKKLIERKVDRLVFNVENSIAVTGGTALDALLITPRLRVQDEQISMIGKSGMMVMVDDRLIQLSGEDLSNYLKTIPADDIKSIEVISTPPAKYSAEGNSGLINIIMKKTSKDIFSGNLLAAFTKNTKESFNTNLALNYNKNNFHWSAKLRYSNWNMAVYENQNVAFTDGKALNNHADRIDKSVNVGANVNLSYKMTKKNSIGLIYDYGNTNSVYNNLNNTSYYTGSVRDSLLATTSSYKNPSDIHTLSIYDDIVLDSTGSNLSFVFNYFENMPRTNLEFQTTSSNNTHPFRTLNTSKLKYSVLSGQADYSLPAKWGNFEAGVRFTRFGNNSDIRYSDSRNIQHDNMNSLFRLTEDNYAVYTSFVRKLGENWSVKAGLRYEYTALETSEPLGDVSYKTRYGKLFPNLNILYRTENNTYTVNYNKRINRPRLGQLNPFRWYSNPYFYNVGNPFLQPSVSHNIELNYLHRGMFMASLFATRQENAFGALITIDNGKKETKTENVYIVRNIGLNTSFDKDVLSFWNISVNASGFYSASTSEYPEVEAFKGWSASYSIGNTFTLSQKKTWILFLNFDHILPGVESNIKSEGLLILAFGSRFNLFQEKLTCNIRVNDMLKAVSKGYLAYNGFVQNYNNYYDNRSLVISLSYNFGTKKSTLKNIRFDEQQRAK